MTTSVSQSQIHAARGLAELCLLVTTYEFSIDIPCSFCAIVARARARVHDQRCSCQA